MWNQWLSQRRKSRLSYTSKCRRTWNKSEQHQSAANPWRYHGCRLCHHHGERRAPTCLKFLQKPRAKRQNTPVSKIRPKRAQCGCARPLVQWPLRGCFPNHQYELRFMDRWIGFWFIVPGFWSLVSGSWFLVSRLNHYKPILNLFINRTNYLRIHVR